MPRGSKIGERRGGRQRGTPNRRTVLADRILAIGSERPTTSACQLVDVLVTDHELPADIRMAIAREFLSAGTSRSVGASAVRSSARKPRKAKSTGRRPEPPGNRRLATLDGLLSIAQDTTVPTDQRRKAALAAAQHFLPKKPGIKRWWVKAPADEYGFAVTPQIAAEYRDIKFELRRWTNSGSNSPAISRKAEKLRARMQAILHRLQCPSPSLYGMDQRQQDKIALFISCDSAWPKILSPRRKRRKRRTGAQELTASIKDLRARHGSGWLYYETRSASLKTRLVRV